MKVANTAKNNIKTVGTSHFKFLKPITIGIAMIYPNQAPLEFVSNMIIEKTKHIEKITKILNFSLEDLFTFNSYRQNGHINVK